jgi:hypothetical protein
MRCAGACAAIAVLWFCGLTGTGGGFSAAAHAAGASLMGCNCPYVLGVGAAGLLFFECRCRGDAVLCGRIVSRIVRVYLPRLECMCGGAQPSVLCAVQFAAVSGSLIEQGLPTCTCTWCLSCVVSGICGPLWMSLGYVLRDKL